MWQRAEVCKGVLCPFPSSLMFWTNWNEQHPSIMRATLSGSNVLIIIDQDIRTPNGLAIDHRAEKIYFSDATLDKIERCEYDGSHRHVSPDLPGIGDEGEGCRSRAVPMAQGHWASPSANSRGQAAVGAVLGAVL